MASVKVAAAQEERTHPRRRKDAHDDQPLFLRKAYSMITDCPEHLGGWSEAGDSFIVKDIAAFASTIIPTVYKHNNWASFVRQLNFYGFRKIKAEKLNQNTWWEFKHSLFMRGQPRLMCEIKRLNHFEEAPVSSVGIIHLQNEVTELRSKIDTMNESLVGLTGQMAKLSTANESLESDRGKKRHRVANIDTSFDDFDLFTSGWGEEDADNGLSEIDQDMWGLLDSFGPEDPVEVDANVKIEPVQEIVPCENTLIPQSVTTTLSNANTIAPAVPPADVSPATSISMDDITRVLTALDPSLQARFVDKLAESFGTQLAKTFQPVSSVGTTVGHAQSSSKVQSSSVRATFTSQRNEAHGVLSSEKEVGHEALSPAYLCTFINTLVELSARQPTCQIVDQVQVTAASKEAAFHSLLGQVPQGCH